MGSETRYPKARRLDRVLTGLQAAHAESSTQSAWPDRFPGSWATAADVAGCAGMTTHQLKYTLGELVAMGLARAERPWPGPLLGYQPTQRQES